MPRITLATLPNASAQEVFDHVARHLFLQGAKCTVGSGSCAYRDDTGKLACAAGSLISDEEYAALPEDISPNSFGRKTRTAPWDMLIFHGLVPKDHERLIISLQSIHDTWPIDKWSDGLRSVANGFNLNLENPA
jgi:hypothetical protein